MISDIKYVFFTFSTRYKKNSSYKDTDLDFPENRKLDGFASIHKNTYLLRFIIALRFCGFPGKMKILLYFWCVIVTKGMKRSQFNERSSFKKFYNSLTGT